MFPDCLNVIFFPLKLRAFTDNRDDMALGHVVVLLQHEWPRGENLFLKAINKICQQGNFQYENFFNYVTSILSLTKNVFYILCCNVEKAVSFNSSFFPESYSVFIFIPWKTLVVGSVHNGHFTQCKYFFYHLPWHLRVPLSTLPLHFHSEKQQQLWLLMQVTAISSLRNTGHYIQGC